MHKMEDFYASWNFMETTELQLTHVRNTYIRIITIQNGSAINFKSYPGSL